MERFQRVMETMLIERIVLNEKWRNGSKMLMNLDWILTFPIHRSDDESRSNEGGYDETNHSHSSSTPVASPLLPKATGSSFERQRICVICQDEDANIAIIDYH